MRILEAEGVRFEINSCKKCEKVCSDQEAIAHLRRWDHLLHPCAFCGVPIRPILMEIDHVHKSDVDEEGWGVTYGRMEYEPHYDWCSHGPLGWFEIRAHIHCAKKGMPYANFEKEDDRPKVIPDGVPVPRASFEKCQTCGDTPTLEDLTEVVSQIYSYFGPCSYCNKPIQVLEVQLEHGPRIKSDPHEDWWHWKNYMREASFHWWGYSASSGECRSTNFYGHLTCMMKKMPYCRWSELEHVYMRLGEARPELADRRLRRYVSGKVAEKVRKCRTVEADQIQHLVLATLQGLEGPREWIPGLVK